MKILKKEHNRSQVFNQYNRLSATVAQAEKQKHIGTGTDFKNIVTLTYLASLQARLSRASKSLSQPIPFFLDDPIIRERLFARFGKPESTQVPKVELSLNGGVDKVYVSSLIAPLIKPCSVLVEKCEVPVPLPGALTRVEETEESEPEAVVAEEAREETTHQQPSVIVGVECGVCWKEFISERHDQVNSDKDGTGPLCRCVGWCCCHTSYSRESRARRFRDWC